MKKNQVNKVLLMMVTFVVFFSFVLFVPEAMAEEVVLAKIRARASAILMGFIPVVYLFAGFGLVGFAFMAVFNKISWTWFGNIAMGLLLIFQMKSLINFATRPGYLHVHGRVEPQYIDDYKANTQAERENEAVMDCLGKTDKDGKPTKECTQLPKDIEERIDDKIREIQKAECQKLEESERNKCLSNINPGGKNKEGSGNGSGNGNGNGSGGGNDTRGFCKKDAKTKEKGIAGSGFASCVKDIIKTGKSAAKTLRDVKNTAQTIKNGVETIKNSAQNIGNAFKNINSLESVFNAVGSIGSNLNNIVGTTGNIITTTQNNIIDAAQNIQNMGKTEEQIKEMNKQREEAKAAQDRARRICNADPKSDACTKAKEEADKASSGNKVVDFMTKGVVGDVVNETKNIKKEVSTVNGMLQDGMNTGADIAGTIGNTSLASLGLGKNNETINGNIQQKQQEKRKKEREEQKQLDDWEKQQEKERKAADEAAARNTPKQDEARQLVSDANALENEARNAKSDMDNKEKAKDAAEKDYDAKNQKASNLEDEARKARDEANRTGSEEDKRKADLAEAQAKKARAEANQAETKKNQADKAYNEAKSNYDSNNYDERVKEAKSKALDASIEAADEARKKAQEAVDEADKNIEAYTTELNQKESARDEAQKAYDEAVKKAKESGNKKDILAAQAAEKALKDAEDEYKQQQRKLEDEKKHKTESENRRDNAYIYMIEKQNEKAGLTDDSASKGGTGNKDDKSGDGKGSGGNNQGGNGNKSGDGKGSGDNNQGGNDNDSGKNNGSDDNGNKNSGSDTRGGGDDNTNSGSNNNDNTGKNDGSSSSGNGNGSGNSGSGNSNTRSGGNNANTGNNTNGGSVTPPVAGNAPQTGSSRSSVYSGSSTGGNETKTGSNTTNNNGGATSDSNKKTTTSSIDKSSWIASADTATTTETSDNVEETGVTASGNNSDSGWRLPSVSGSSGHRSSGTRSASRAVHSYRGTTGGFGYRGSSSYAAKGNNGAVSTGGARPSSEGRAAAFRARQEALLQQQEAVNSMTADEPAVQANEGDVVQGISIKTISCVNADGKIVGYVDEDSKVKDLKGRFLGDLMEDGTVINKDGEIVATAGDEIELILDENGEVLSGVDEL